MKIKNHLKPSEQNILVSFVKVFLPPTGSKRKNSGNEIDYLSKTLDKVFVQRFGINISQNATLDLFKSLPDYLLFEVDGELDLKDKIIKHSKSGFPSYFTYIDVSPKAVRLLRKTTAKLPDNTNSSKVAEVEELIRQVEEFKSQIINSRIS